MLDLIANEIINLRRLIISIIVISIMTYAAFFLTINNFKWKKSKVKLFSLVYGFDTVDCICLAIMFSRCIYVSYLSINNDNFGVEYLITLLFMSIMLNILEKDFANIFTSVLSSVAIYVIIYLQSSLRYFYNYVESDSIVMIMIVSLMVFTILFAIFSLISSYNHLIVLNNNGSKKSESLAKTNKIKWPKIRLSGKLKSSH